MINLTPNNPHESGMFIKLNKQFDNITYSKGGEFVSYGGIISYSEVEGINSELFNVVPEKYRSEFSLSVMEILGEVPPHTDSDVKTVVNFYLESGDYKTIFFSGKTASYQVKNQTDGEVFERDGLVEIGYFVAKNGDAYCLDVDSIHAVDALHEDAGNRTAICLSTENYNFEQVCNMLCDSGYIN
jgi:hypothetical protein